MMNMTSVGAFKTSFIDQVLVNQASSNGTMKLSSAFTRKKVRCPELYEPRQHPTRRGFKTKVDCYLSRLSKFPLEIAVAHSRYEMLLWGILEGIPAYVIWFRNRTRFT